MYTPEHFRVADEARGFALIEENAFGLLVCPSATGAPELVHLPFVLDRPRRALRCHVARANPIARTLSDGDAVVAVFSGPHAYVSPSWYENPAKNVPTWNYAAVHAHGRVRSVALREEVLRDLETLTRVYEGASAAPWELSKADPSHIEKLLGGLAAYEIPIERLEVKFKMSQNRTPADRIRVAAALDARGGPADAAVARLVRELNGISAE